MSRVNSVLYTISKLTTAVSDILIVLVFTIFKNSNLVINIAVSNVRIRIYLFLKSNVYILNAEVIRILELQFNKLSWINLSSVPFLSHRSIEIEPQKESTKLTGKDILVMAREKRKYWKNCKE